MANPTRKKSTGIEKTNEGAPEKAGLIVAAAKAIGSAAGTVAHSIGIRDEPVRPLRPAGKLPPKHKSRLPRRLKKAMQKEMARQEAV
jgi:hypothetical protein